MSRQVRNRVTAIVLGGLIFGAPMLANGVASAQPVPEGTRQVTFTGGGMFGISCGSEPSVESMTVPAQSTVRVVNQTGYAAKLLLGGDEKGSLDDNASADVIFRRGTTAVMVKPSCAIGDDASPMMVTTSPSATAPAQPEPAPTAPADDVSPMSLAPAGSGDSSGTPSGSNAAPAERPSRARPADTAPDVRKQPSLRSSGVAAQAARTAAQAMPHGGAAPQAKTKTASRTAGSAAPAFAGMPPGDEKTLLPGVPRLDLEPVTIGAEPAAPAPPPTQIAAAEPVATLEPMPEGSPLGLLALTAAVCVVGVTVAAIRAIVSQRANRAQIA
ncbi:hypothetical protein JIG36_15250 [Actinoplanes sp. LDG1-06]|uniref:Uncharacterized protein n=1 Tax=Paractinoplanes ovalisporus TaxID=2810368 RepID=A0ABS2AAP9_9ACTN|nr:hypothetical protein [Actinoplanes ovalisporus]MBM2616914.1 hypothetical protein [Actinoplanes ovalisporus]